MGNRLGDWLPIPNQFSRLPNYSITQFEYHLMDHLTSPKLTPGVHCLNIRHKGMFVTSGPDPDEFTFYDKYDSTAYWCVETQRGFGPDGAPVRPDCCAGERDCCKH